MFVPMSRANNFQSNMPESLCLQSITIPGSDGVKTGKMNIISVVLRARRMCIICRARLLLTTMYLLVCQALIRMVFVE
jgi:hypothetical protein